MAAQGFLNERGQPFNHKPHRDDAESVAMIAPQFANTRDPGKCIWARPRPALPYGRQVLIKPPEDLPLRPAQLRFGGG